MADDIELIRSIFKEAGATLAADDVWQVQGARVVKHKALERLAAAIGLAFEAPNILRAEREEAVILVTGKHPNGASEWSIGEACVNVNYRVSGKQAAYVYAMAEKRAKDRVILKLAGLHGVYSEDEADDFKQPSGRDEAPSAGTLYANAAIKIIESEHDIDALVKWWDAEKPKRADFFTNTDPDFQRLKAAFAKRGAELKAMQKEAA